MNYIKYTRDGGQEERTTVTYAKRVRTGKTEKDHKSGAWAQRAKNQQARDAANKERKR